MTCADSSNNPAEGVVLAVNGADERLQIALGRMAGGSAELLAAEEWTVPGEAVRFLAPGVQRMLHGLGLPPRGVTHAACVRGPGSFTGLRMSLAFVEGLAAATGALLAGLDHLPVLAREAALLLPPGGAVLPLVWSRRGQVYAEPFGPGGNALAEACVLPLENAAAFLRSLPRPLWLLGGGLRRNLAFFENLAADDSSLRLLPQACDAPRPAVLLAAAAAAAYGSGPLSPTYLRASDAENNLAAIAAGRGLSEAQARAILDRGSQPL